MGFGYDKEDWLNDVKKVVASTGIKPCPICKTNEFLEFKNEENGVWIECVTWLDEGGCGARGPVRTINMLDLNAVKMTVLFFNSKLK